MASTRSKTRLRECNTAEESTIADLASVVRRARISSTVRRRTVNPDAPAALIPMSGGVTIDHSASERVPTTSPVPPARGCHVPRPYRRAQPKPAEPPHAPYGI
ncbi:hypothetical protein EVAR_98988_1 [Eumeta japonica]|uniref:Uncharacterized protein n=1 Tax=Eumeta variegata TaxID=151549 RepID=A0A4C1YT88_EUMVA|nr:hypothetical protein EVAR_98988_1 [Eumeta japonica]